MEMEPEWKPGKVWVSAATAVSLCVTWMAPGEEYSPRLEYNLEQADISLNQPSSLEWSAVAEQHTGWLPSHVVTGLVTGRTYSFRVHVTAPDGHRVTSEASDPFTVAVPFWCCYSFGHQWQDPPPVDRFSDKELGFFKTLDTPMKVQDWIDQIPMNHELVDDTCLSPLEVVRQNHCHCIEGAMLAAFILSLHGYPALMMDMRACSRDDDHNVTPFQREMHGLWGCSIGCLIADARALGVHLQVEPLLSQVPESSI
eukprot:TRINITY_DN25460_c0_g1_i1.p1 TRINITY_DN25460_c0_g1~~TRINITY_DN25460_c0_g1_i1.p1  ORF type:complete len:255 (+),score=37.53 TRINITY_DN25460_c0_g1_i1:195-959(+)